MTDAYARDERIAIRMCSGMTEREAIKLTDTEGRQHESVEKLKAFLERKKMDDAKKHLKQSRRFNYD